MGVDWSTDPDIVHQAILTAAICDIPIGNKYDEPSIRLLVNHTKSQGLIRDSEDTECGWKITAAGMQRLHDINTRRALVAETAARPR